MKFIGWTPTVTGRLSFSSIGTPDGHSKAATCNFSSFPQRCIFTVGTKVSHDGPIPSWLLPRRIEKAHFIAYLEVESARLPYPPGLPGAVPELREDARGALVGTIIVCLLGEGREQKAFRAKLNDFQHIAESAKDPNRSSADHTASSQAAKGALAEFWAALSNVFHSNPRVAPAFAKVQIKLLRSGQTELDISPADFYLTYQSKSAQLTKSLTEGSKFFRTDAAMIARQAFHFVRDLAHRHYHHSPHSDLATTTYSALAIDGSSRDDATWRRETHYGLLRMAISSRREDHVLQYKQSLGILAYAEAFQTQLAGWQTNAAGNAEARSDFFPYNFKPFRDSIEARVRVKEATALIWRTSTTFVIATCLSVLAIILSSSNLLRSDRTLCSKHFWQCAVTSDFWTLIGLTSQHPAAALITALLGSSLVMWLLELVPSQKLAMWRSDVARFTDALMGEIGRFEINVAWVATVVLSAGAASLLFWLGYLFLVLAKYLWALGGG